MERGFGCSLQQGVRAPGCDADAEAYASEFLHRLNDVADHEMRLRYDLGRFLHGVRYDAPRASPSNVLGRLAQVLGWHPSALRRCARVTEMIAADEFERITKLRGEQGWRLTWSHIELLSEVRNRGARWTLIEAVLHQKLSVRALASRVRGRRRRAAAAEHRVVGVASVVAGLELISKSAG